ncbi:response regulator [Paenibacillus yanchengensis]|uniref:Response regulator n=1 Tax=Paenibacillus yanchengensis TaxID=2035833 RepID=A0ABW4YQI3_9BACL
MRRLLIVDDEPIIVNGLQQFFIKKQLNDVEVVTAYSAKEALTWLESIHIDVVLSDICMPELDGLQLLQAIEKFWPRCKVVLLTGHDEFEYAHQALRSANVIDYILKTEGMEKIGQSVQHAFYVIREELSVYHHKVWLQEELPQALMQLQQQLLREVLREVPITGNRQLQTEFTALQLPLDTTKSVLVIMLHIEQWGKYETTSERDLMLFAISNIVEELLADRVTVKCVQYDGYTIAAVIQLQKEGVERRGLEQEKGYVPFVHRTLEVIQQTSRELFTLHISIAASGQLRPFNELSSEVNRLRLVLLSDRFRGNERLAITSFQPLNNHEEKRGRQAAFYFLEKMHQSLLQEQGEDWPHYFQKFVNLFTEDGPMDPFDRLLIVQALTRQTILCLEELGLKDKAIAESNLLYLFQIDPSTSWREIISFYRLQLEWMQAMRNDHLQLEQSNLIGRIHYFVRNNLHRNVSVSAIAREVSLNPSYLSRWYKQTCGHALSDFIQEVRIERSKELLATTTCKIHEISEKLGLADTQYFYRFFKKNVGCTPQEYRNQFSN